MTDETFAEVMTIEDVAAFLRIPVSSAYKLAQEGKIPALKVGRHWRIYRPTLMQWIAASSPPAGPTDSQPVEAAAV